MISEGTFQLKSRDDLDEIPNSVLLYSPLLRSELLIHKGAFDRSLVLSENLKLELNCK